MPSTIRDLTELTTVATDDYILISDTSDVTNRDKRISITNLQSGVVKTTGTQVVAGVKGFSSYIGIGTGGPTDPVGELEVHTTAIAPATRGLVVSQINTGVHAPIISIMKARGTRASATTVANGDGLAYIQAMPWDGASWLSTAAIHMRVNGTVATNSVPTEIAFRTGSPTIADRLVIGATGLATFSNGLSFGQSPLSYYEEGTWTPTLRFGALSVGMTFSIRTGTYTRIGNMVILTMVLTLSAKGSSVGSADISGLPFAPVLSAPSAVRWANMQTALFNMWLVPSTGSTNLAIRAVTAASTAGGAALSDTDFTATGNIQGAFFYAV
jgi:hypothetical protein